MVIRVHFPDLVPGQVPMAYAASLRVNGLAGAILQPGPEYSKFDQLTYCLQACS